MNARQGWNNSICWETGIDYKAEARAEAIEARVPKLMAPGAEFDPLEARNFDEAISEELATSQNTLSGNLAAALREGKPANQLLIDASTAYWLKQAEQRAEDDIEIERENALEARAEARSEEMHERAMSDPLRYWLTH